MVVGLVGSPTTDLLESVDCLLSFRDCVRYFMNADQKLTGQTRLISSSDNVKHDLEERGVRVCGIGFFFFGAVLR